MIKLENVVKKYSTETEIGPLNFTIEKMGLIQLLGQMELASLQLS